jgi:UDP-N-acetyl-D-mannosaminuronic acid dehydrogenase
MERQKVCVMGLGYIGLPTASLLATNGYNVHGVDIIPEVIKTINNGKIHIKEPALDAFVKSAVQSGNLKASLEPDYADIFIITVPTPIDENNNPNIDYVISATNSIAPYVKDNNIVILESTSPVGTTEKLVGILKKFGVNVDKIHVAYSPERVLPGQTMRELVENDRIVGGITKEAALHVMLFYETFIQGEVLTTDARTAEMTKLTENANRDVNIAFANELSILCDKFEIDVWELIELANRHPRINILKPGSGVGGHCIAVDPWFIIAQAEKEARIIKTAREINNFKPLWVVDKILDAAKKFEESHNRKPVTGCMGIAFKPNIDDLRESPSFHIVFQLLNEKLNVKIVEPNINKHPNLNIEDMDDVINQSDIIVFLVAHKEFKDVKIPEDKIIIDICGVRSKYN